MNVISWGAALAVEYAAKNPGKLAGVVMISTGLCTSQWNDEFPIELKQQGLENGNPEEIFLAPDERELGEPLLEQIWKTFSKETFDSLNSSYINNYDARLILGSIQVPVINIFGQYDIRFPVQVTKSYRDFNARIINFEVEGAGHFPFLKSKNRESILQLIRQNFIG